MDTSSIHKAYRLKLNFSCNVTISICKHRIKTKIWQNHMRGLGYYIKDPEILFVFKDLMAACWDELPDTLISDANKALSKNTDDKAAQEAVWQMFSMQLRQSRSLVGCSCL
ncbi:unnamed protein product [Camellia sinensis]